MEELKFGSLTADALGLTIGIPSYALALGPPYLSFLDIADS